MTVAYPGCCIGFSVWSGAIGLRFLEPAMLVGWLPDDHMYQLINLLAPHRPSQPQTDRFITNRRVGCMTSAAGLRLSSAVDRHWVLNWRRSMSNWWRISTAFTSLVRPFSCCIINRLSSYSESPFYWPAEALCSSAHVLSSVCVVW